MRRRALGLGARRCRVGRVIVVEGSFVVCERAEFSVSREACVVKKSPIYSRSVIANAMRSRSENVASCVCEVSPVKLRSGFFVASLDFPGCGARMNDVRGLGLFMSYFGYWS